MSIHEEQTVALSKLECYPKLVAELYTEAAQLFSSKKFAEAADKVEAALKELDGYQEEEKQTWGFAELQLLYGRSLLEMIKCSASNNDDIFGPKVPKVVELQGSDSEEAEEEDDVSEKEDNLSEEICEEVDGEDTNELQKQEIVSNLKEGKEGNAAEVEATSDNVLPSDTDQQLTEETNPEEAKESEGEEQDVRELAWEQLECARVIFSSKLPESRLRLAVAYEALGDFGMENDNNEQAAEDFKSAVRCYEEAGYALSRTVGGLYHSIYLALRSIDPHNARKYLKLAAQVFEKRISESQKQEGQADDTKAALDDEKEILKEIELEIADFDSVISNQEKENSDGMKGDPVTQVTRVEPRKRADTKIELSKEQETALHETFDDANHEMVPNKKSRTCKVNEDHPSTQQ